LGSTAQAFARGNADRVKDELLMIKTEFDKAKYALKQALQSDSIDEQQKSVLKEELDRIIEKEQEVLTGINESMPAQGVISVRVQVQQLAQQVIMSINNIQQANMKAAQEKAAKEAADAAKEGAEGNQGAEGGAGNAEGSNISPEAAKKVEEKLKKDKTEALKIISNIYNGSIGNAWGTDYEQINKGAKDINENNAANVIAYWEEQYAPTCGKSIIKALFDEEHLWQPSLHCKDRDKYYDGQDANNMDALWKMTVCMKKQAEKLGIYNDLAGQFDVVFDELDDFKVDEDAVETGMKAIAATICAKQTEKLAQNAQEGIDSSTKLDETKDVAARKAEVEAEKKQEFQNTLRKAYDLGEQLPELTEGFKVITDDNGEFKEYQVTVKGYTPFKGKTFTEIIAELEEYDIDPKKALLKQKLDTKS
jgi:hypothetical protein